MVFSVLTPKNLRFSTSSIFLVFAFPGMCVISVLQNTHFQKDAIIHFFQTSPAVPQPLRVKTCHCISLGIGSHFRKYVNRLEYFDKWLRPLIFSALNRSSSHRCGFEPISGQMWDKPSSASDGQVGFFGDLPFSPNLMTDSAENEWNNLDGP